jgi:hypothetical protein
MNRPKAIGTAVETAVVRYLQGNGYPHAERRARRGTADAGDIAGTIGICWSIKGGAAAENASDAVIDGWLGELDRQRQHAQAGVGVLVCKRRAVGPANAGAWWAILDAHTITTLVDPGAGPYAEAPAPPVRLRLADAVALLRWAGYGVPLDAVTEVTG